MRTRQVGRFKISARFFDGLQAGDGANLFAGMIVIDVRRDWISNTAEYICVHHDFRHCNDGEITPEYRAIFTAGTALPKWEEVTQNA